MRRTYCPPPGPSAMTTHARFLALLLLLGLVGCAAPRYQTITHRDAPVGPAAQACLEGCAARLDTCRRECADKYQACLKRVEPDADAHYRQALERYAAELERYRRQLADAQFHLWLGWHRGWGGFWYDPWFDPWPYPATLPPPPPAPNRDAVLAAFRETKCGGDCGCQPPHDACFLACGGIIRSETRCVANCPEKP